MQKPKHHVVPAAAFAGAAEAELVEGEGMQRLRLFEDELSKVVGGQGCHPPIKTGPPQTPYPTGPSAPPYTPTFSFAAQNVEEDDCESD
jgi:hypothetical protein